MKNHLFNYTILGFVLLLTDQTLKFFARTNPNTNHYLIDPYLGWEYLGNTGIAFSLPIPNLVLVLVSPIIILGLFVLLRRHYRNRLVSLGLILIMFGAISNYTDRVLFALTVDYIRIYTSVFNIADIMVVLGAGLLIVKEKKV